MKYKLLLWMLTGFLSWTSCTDTNVPEVSSDDMGKEYRLEFSVSVQADRADDKLNEEILINSIYVYAFDDVHQYPDFFVDKVVNQEDSYKVSMMINGIGQKRFYLFANPPRYVREVLTATCPEGTLKTLGIFMRKPIKKMSELPQSADGVSDTGGKSGFPMANQMVAYANLGDKEREVFLSAAPDRKGGRITRIPIFRSLGKISVVAWRKKNQSQEMIKVTGMYIFNYGCDGYFAPIWDTNKEKYWEDVSPEGIAGWNTALNMDLTEMVKRETQAGVDAVSVMEQETEVLPENNSTENARLLSSFYLCQNSYGRKMDGETQDGIPDPMGNRTSKMLIVLNDGRTSEIELPYLRRNDHLKIRIGITENTLQVEFLKWNQSEIIPDWDDGVYHPAESVQFPIDKKSES